MISHPLRVACAFTSSRESYEPSSDATRVCDVQVPTSLVVLASLWQASRRWMGGQTTRGSEQSVALDSTDWGSARDGDARDSTHSRKPMRFRNCTEPRFHIEGLFSRAECISFPESRCTRPRFDVQHAQWALIGNNKKKILTIYAAMLDRWPDHVVVGSK